MNNQLNTIKAGHKNIDTRYTIKFKDWRNRDDTCEND